MNHALSPKKGITGTTLKIIAIIAMIIDHTAAGILIPYIPLIKNPDTYNFAISSYYIMRTIGRIAFPIFCFLLVEGFVHTKNIKKYALNLGLFVLISEIPFDLNFSETIFSLEYQNVFFTLFIGLIMLIGYKTMEQRYKDNQVLKWILILSITILAFLLAEFLRTDYAGAGIITIGALYLSRSSKLQPIVGTLAVIVSTFVTMGFQTAAFEAPAIFAIPAIYMYNGQRGKNLKYFFYLFYPVHLMIIYFIAQALTK